MGFIVLLAFIAIPMAEIAVFISVGGVIGLWPTLAIVVLTAFIGTYLLRRQGLGVLREIEIRVNQGDIPVQALFDGACLLLAGALLLTPGFITDTLGLLLFLPPVRRYAGRLILHHFTLRAARRQGPGYQATIIDGEFTHVPQNNRLKDGNDGE